MCTVKIIKTENIMSILSQFLRAKFTFFKKYTWYYNDSHSTEVCKQSKINRFKIKLSLTLIPRVDPFLQRTYTLLCIQLEVFLRDFVPGTVLGAGESKGSGRTKDEAAMLPEAHLKQCTHLLVLILQCPEPPPGCFLQGAIYTPSGAALHSEGECQILKRTEGERSGWKCSNREERIR